MIGDGEAEDMSDMAFLVQSLFADGRLDTHVPGGDDGPEKPESQNGDGDAEMVRPVRSLWRKAFLKSSLEDEHHSRTPLSRCRIMCALSGSPRVVGDHDDRLPRLAVEPVHEGQHLLRRRRGPDPPSVRRPPVSVGSVTTARAMATRCCSPPESWPG